MYNLHIPCPGQSVYICIYGEIHGKENKVHHGIVQKHCFAFMSQGGNLKVVEKGGKESEKV